MRRTLLIGCMLGAALTNGAWFVADLIVRKRDNASTTAWFEATGISHEPQTRQSINLPRLFTPGPPFEAEVARLRKCGATRFHLENNFDLQWWVIEAPHPVEPLYRCYAYKTVQTPPLDWPVD